MDLQKLIKKALVSVSVHIESIWSRGYDQGFIDGVNKLADLIKQQSDKDADEFQEKVSRMIEECDCNYCKNKK